jgi:hypothetical protein
MAITDISILANFKALLGNYINNVAGLNNQFNDDVIDHFIRSGLNEMAIYANPRFTKLKTESTLTVTAQAAAFPANYLHHNVSDILQCTVSGNANSFLQFTDSREDFVKAANAYSGFNRYIIVGTNIEVSNANISAIIFEYTREPDMLDGSTNTDDFIRSDMYEKLILYVLGKLFQAEAATTEQKQQSAFYFQQFYQEIGASDQEVQIEKQLDLRTRTNA